MEPRAVLLLTGTVNPNKMVFTKLKDIESRRTQYIDAIKFWISSTSLPIIFVENSDSDISLYLQPEIATNRLEVLNFDGNKYPRYLGKGYGELACLEYAYQFSKCVKGANFIFKVTGRHKVLNFNTFLDYYRRSPEIGIMVDFRQSLQFCDSRFFGFKPSFIVDYLLEFKSIINDSEGVFFEHILAKAALFAIVCNYIFSPMVSCPRIEGISGSTGSTYDSSHETWLQKTAVYQRKYQFFRQK